jgi:hypothetical protein
MSRTWFTCEFYAPVFSEGFLKHLSVKGCRLCLGEKYGKVTFQRLHGVIWSCSTQGSVNGIWENIMSSHMDCRI